MPWWIKTPWWIKAWIGLVLCSTALAGPVEFGLAELNAAIDARHFKYRPKIVAELNLEAPETFRIDPYSAGGGHITGGDLRGLMYGLLEAADQMRSTGRLKLTHAAPALALRGIRLTANPDAAWFSSTEFWQSYFTSMARSRFNRLEISFDPAPGPSALPVLRDVARIAQQYGVDVAVGLGASAPREIEHLLAICPVVRSVVLHVTSVPNTEELLQTLHDSGRRVVLELPDSETLADVIEAAGASGAPLRLFSPYTETAANPRPRDAYWEMDASQGAPAVNAISGAGFEVGVDPKDPAAAPALDSIAEWGRLGYTRAAP
jgi:hypothetical protein